MQPCRPERFIGVDVADPGDERLVQQDRLQAPAARPDPSSERSRGEARIERLRPETLERLRSA
jgi:hypothetical protein